MLSVSSSTVHLGPSDEVAYWPWFSSVLKTTEMEVDHVQGRSGKDREAGLNDRRTKTTQNLSVELCKPVLDSMNSSPLLMGKLVLSLSWSYLKAQLRPRERNDFARATDWYFDVDQSRSLKQVKKLRPWPATGWSAPRPRVSSPPFSTAKKIDIKTLNSVRGSAPFNISVHFRLGQAGSQFLEYWQSTVLLLVQCHELFYTSWTPVWTECSVSCSDSERRKEKSKVKEEDHITPTSFKCYGSKRKKTTFASDRDRRLQPSTLSKDEKKKQKDWTSALKTNANNRKIRPWEEYLDKFKCLEAKCREKKNLEKSNQSDHAKQWGFLQLRSRSRRKKKERKDKKEKEKTSECIGRELNPGLTRGRREFIPLNHQSVHVKYFIRKTSKALQ